MQMINGDRGSLVDRMVEDVERRRGDQREKESKQQERVRSMSVPTIGD